MLNWQDGQWIGYERSGGWALDLLGRFARERLRAARFLVRGTFEGLLPTGSGAIRTEWRSYNGARLLGMSENEAVLASL